MKKIRLEPSFDALIIGILIGAVWGFDAWQAWAAMIVWTIVSTVCAYVDRRRGLVK